MRLRIFKKIFVEEYARLNLMSSQQPGNPPKYSINNLFNLRESINRLSQTKVFDEQVNSLRGTAIFGNQSDSIQVNSAEFSLINTAISEMRKTIQALIRSFEEANIDEVGSDFISIKLPDVKSFNELGDISNKLSKAIEIPINDSGAGKSEIINFDTGSFWIDVLIGSSIGVSIVSSIAWAGAVVFKKIQEGKMYQEYAKGLKVKNEHLEEVSILAKKEIELIVEAEAKFIQSQHFENQEDFEKLERIKLSIRSMSELIAKGTEVHPSLTAPENIKELFPNYATLNLIESKIKQIGNG